MESQRIVVVGAGAMGSMFGGRLAEGGADVTLVDVNRDHIGAIQQNGGLILTGHGGDRHIPIRATTDASTITGPIGIALFQCKAIYNPQAAASVRHLFAESGAVAVSFQNGLGNEEVIEGILGKGRVVAGLTSQSAMMEAPGRVRHVVDLPTDMGEIGGGLSDRVTRWADFLSRHGLSVTASADVTRDKWRKLLGNIGLSAISGATNLTAGQIVDDPQLRAVALRAIDEAAAVASASGIPINQAEAYDIFYQIALPPENRQMKSSMRRDLEAGRHSEVQQIYESVVGLGERHGVPTPTLHTLAALIRGLEKHFIA
ncbi:ketopantoate reductase family protein [Paracoccus versutus]